MDWNEPLRPLIEKYRGRPHPLNHQGNRYRMLVMVLLSAQDSDVNINNVTVKLFDAFPSMEKLATATESQLHTLLRTVQNYESKVRWLIKIAAAVRTDDAIPTNRKGLVALPGIGPKSANVILRESGLPAEGIIVDLHVIRVANRLGMAKEEDGTKLEKVLVALLNKESWNEVGMAMSFLSRETCRPTYPKCPECVMNAVCAYRASRAS